VEKEKREAGLTQSTGCFSSLSHLHPAQRIRLRRTGNTQPGQIKIADFQRSLALPAGQADDNNLPALQQMLKPGSLDPGVSFSRQPSMVVTTEPQTQLHSVSPRWFPLARICCGPTHLDSKPPPDLLQWNRTKSATQAKGRTYFRGGWRTTLEVCRRILKSREVEPACCPRFGVQEREKNNRDAGARSRAFLEFERL
jgi:hypothetical protein